MPAAEDAASAPCENVANVFLIQPSSGIIETRSPGTNKVPEASGQAGRNSGEEAAHTRTVLLFWFLFINVVAYLVMSDDKKRAKQRRERIPEKTLFLLAAIGGALGVLLAMNTKRHKTKHLSFKVGVPLLLLLNAVLYGYFLI